MKQKLLAILLVLGMVGALIPVFAVTSAAANGVALPDGATAYDGTPSTELSGTGTETDPYIIANTADFMYFYNTLAATATAGQFFKMTGDVYWNAQNSTKYAVSSKAFAGILDGNGHTIYNAYNNTWNTQSVFGTVTGTIRNLVFDGTSFTSKNADAAGVCTALDGGLIDNVHMKNANIAGKNASGIVQTIKGEATVNNCSFEGMLGHDAEGNKAGAIAGIVGSLSDNAIGTVKNCVNRATISQTKLDKIEVFGGIVATYKGSSYAIKSLIIENCENNCTFTATATTAHVGGILGSSFRAKSVKLIDCTNNANLTGTGNTGGMIGLAGWIENGTGYDLQGCLNKGVIVSTGDNAGGLVGSHDGAKANLQIAECANYANVTGVNNVGGLVGKNNGEKQNILVTTSAAYGNVTATGNYAGLIVGCHTDTAAIVTATDCVFSGTVSATEGAGAVAGSSNSAPTITNTYFSGVAGLKLVAAGTAATEATATDADFTGKTVLDALNAAAVTAGLPEDTWVKGQASGKPELKQFCTDPEEDQPETPSVTIDGASLTIGNSVTLNMFVYKKTLEAAGVSSLQSIHIRDSASENYQGKLVDDKYVFQIKGLTANDFGTTRSYTVQYVTNDNMVVVSKAVKEYSPLQYAINMYGKRTDMATLDPLLLAIVNYAEAAGATGAKKAFNDKHADADWTKLPAYEAVLAGDTNVAQYTYKTLQTEKGLPALSATYLDDKLLLHVDLYGCDYTKVSVKIGNVDAGDITGFPSVEFYPTDLYNTIEFTFATDAGEEVVATWSIMQYLDSYKNSSRKDFAKATAIYLYAVRAFCIANHN